MMRPRYSLTSRLYSNHKYRTQATNRTVQKPSVGPEPTDTRPAPGSHSPPPTNEQPCIPDELTFVTRQPLFASQPAYAKMAYTVSKRLLDISCALILLALGLPVFLLIALMIRMTGGGPVLYKHRRVGLHGREFNCLKFRTMVPNADEILRNNPVLRAEFEKEYKLQHDPRVTPVGRLLRVTSLDELPQLLQVLTGTLSLIGPRPVVREELAKYGEHATKLVSVKPGLSGLWQTCGRSDTTYKERVRMDMLYIDHRSLKLDLRLLLLTVAMVIRRRGAR